MPINKLSTLIGLISLSLLGIAGNYLHLPLFFGVDFIFGSIAALIALRLYGISAGLMVALIAGAYTYVIWGHPYAMIIFTLEVLIVGALLQRRVSSLVLADILYWVFIGMPLVWFFYNNIIGMNENQTVLILLKQPVNGIANAIIATYLLFLIPDRLFTTKQTTTQSRIHLKELLFTTLLAISLSITLLLVVLQSHTAQSEYENSLNNEMQLYVDFLEHQVVDDAGKIKTQLIQGDYHQYKYQRHIILLAKEKVLASSLPPEATEAFLKSGSSKILANGMGLWMPKREGQALMLWWKQANYFIKKPLGPSPEISIVLLQNSQPIIDKLQANATRAFALLFGLILASGVVAYYISTFLTSTILKLTEATQNIAGKLQTGMHIDWPHSAVSELEQLSTQTQLMSESIRETFDDVNTRSSAIIEASVDAVITINDKGIVESFNTAAEEMFNYTRDEILGQNIKTLMPAPYQNNHDGYIHNFADKTRKPFSGLRRELLGLRKDGTTFPIELSLTTINLQNRILYTGIISDISERKANEKLKQEFISTVSHELRTPLTSIQGAIKLIKARKEEATPAETQTMLDLADRNVNRLAELINDLLDFEKLDSDGIEYNIQTVNPDDLLVTVIENDSPMAKQADLTLIHGTSCNGIINADPIRLAQILSNFISNAIKFSGKSESIHIGCHSDDQQVKIYVQDHGQGISEEFKSRVFQRFSQADSSDTKSIQRGTGLGLAISKRMTEDMGGSIGFNSTEGEGSTFYVTFPINKD